MCLLLDESAGLNMSWEVDEEQVSGGADEGGYVGEIGMLGEGGRELLLP